MNATLKRRLRPVLLVVLLAVFGVAVWHIVTQLLTEKADGDRFAALASRVQQAAAEPAADGPLADYAALAAENPDLFGWIRIDGTPVNYPVMFTPTDPEHYLHRAFDGSQSAAGCLFIDAACPPDGPFYLLYGHHMKNGSMFGTLPRYADGDYLREHATVYFDTLTQRRTYQVMAAFPRKSLA